MPPIVEDHPLAVIGVNMVGEIAVIVQPAGGDQLVVDDGAGARRWGLTEGSVGLQLQEEGSREKEVQGL